MTDLSRDEFTTWMELLRGDIRGVQDKLDEQNGRVRATEQKVAVLEDRAGDARKGGMLAGGVVTLIAAIVETLRHYLTGR